MVKNAYSLKLNASMFPLLYIIKVYNIFFSFTVYNILRLIKKKEVIVPLMGIHRSYEEIGNSSTWKRNCYIQTPF